MRAPIVVLAAALLAPVAAFGGIVFPCTPGTFSPTGNIPCTACPPGTYTPSLIGSTTCTACGCNDHIACTIDTCRADNGQCSAEPVPACESVRVDFSGVVTSLETGPVPVEIGMPIEGHYFFDPLAPDSNPLDPVRGDYPAVQRFQARVGAGEPVLELSTKVGTIRVYDDYGGSQDLYEFLVESPFVDEPAELDGDYVSMRLHGGALDTFASDALPPGAPDLAAFANPHLEFSIEEGATVVRTDDFSFDAPEPGAELASAAAMVVVIAFAARHRSTSRA